MPSNTAEITVSAFSNGQAPRNLNYIGTAYSQSLNAGRPSTAYDCAVGAALSPAPWYLENNIAWPRGGGTDNGGNWLTSGATTEWPLSTASLNGTQLTTSVGWVPNVGFIASAPRFPLLLLSLDGLAWSPAPSRLSLGAHDMIVYGNRLYAIESTARPTYTFIDRTGSLPDSYIAGISTNPQLVVATADTFPEFYDTESFFDFPPNIPNGMISNGKYLFVVEDGQRVSRVPLLPPFDPVNSDKPSEPLGVLAQPSGATESVLLSWTAPQSAGTSSITQYIVQSSTDGGGTWSTLPTNVSSLALARTVAGLTNGTQYLFRVAAVNASGRGPFSDITAPYIPRPAPPPAPLSVTATPAGPKESAYIGGVLGSYNVRFRIDWTQSGDGGSPVTGYIIRRYPYDLEVGRLTSSSTTFTTDPASTVRVFSPGDSVQFEVIAINASGESVPSAPSPPVILR